MILNSNLNYADGHKNIFDLVPTSNDIFIDREILRHTYVPKSLPHRQKEMISLVVPLASALNNAAPSNLVLYGLPATGKTVTTKLVGEEITAKAEQLDKKIHFIYINCNITNTTYGILQKISRQMACNNDDKIPIAGLSLDTVYAKLLELLDENSCIAIIVLDEVDRLKADEALYMLTRINTDLKKTKISLILISNNLRFKEFLDSRVNSSLGSENITFEPYNALQLQDILLERVNDALKPESLDESVIPLCAALAAQENGDARKALDLCRVSGEIAERSGDKKITIKHVRLALGKIEKDYIREAIIKLPLQFKLVLFTIYKKDRENKKKGIRCGITTGDIYSIYTEVCKKACIKDLSQRRVTDLIAGLDTLGVVYSRIISKGRKGRVKEIELSVSSDDLIAILQEDEVISGLSSFKIKDQARLF